MTFLTVRNDGITVFMPIPQLSIRTKSVGVPEPEFCSDQFVYDAVKTFMFVLLGSDWLFGSSVVEGKA